MIDMRAAPPGTRLVAGLIALGLLAAAAQRLGRVIVPSPDAVHWPDTRLDLNEASAAELTVLPGLGPALAGKIVEDRGRRGAYGSVDDLRRVDGIGASVIERLRPYLVAGTGRW